MYPKTFYWYDLETFGTRPSVDWPAQCSGIRTDLELNEISPPLNIFCQFPQNKLPQPQACLITGLTPQNVNKKAMCEAEFMAKIYGAFTEIPETCVVGYNNIRFDDEVTRYGFYRNFFDPYAREWQQGNGRWDIINMMRLCAALRPEGVQWPCYDDGRLCFKLEVLAKANHIAHENAHNALSDVKTTIALARLIRSKQRKLFDYLLTHKDKVSAKALLNLSSKKPVVYASSQFSSTHCIAIILPLAEHPNNPQEIIVCNLGVDPSEWLALSTEALYAYLFSTKTENIKRNNLGITTIKLNQCPALAPVAVLRKEDLERLQIDDKKGYAHREKIITETQAAQKVCRAFALHQYANRSNDPDQMLYSEGFFSKNDRHVMSIIRNTPPHQLGQKNWCFEDSRLQQMLFRYRARNWPEVLSKEEQQKWYDFCYQCLFEVAKSDQPTSFDDFKSQVIALQALHADHTKEGKILKQLRDYEQDVYHQFH